MDKKKSILFLSTVNLATNPRILKELKLASKLYRVHFMGFKLGNWSDKLDIQNREFLKEAEFTYISATKTTFVSWLLSSILQVFAQAIWIVFKKNIFLSSAANNKRSFLLLCGIFKLKQGHYDLIVAHTLGALYPAYVLAKLQKTRFAFDVEDYHPGERVGNLGGNEVKRREFLISELLPKCAYFSYSSSLIGEYTLRLLGKLKLPPNLLIRNSFLSTEFDCPDYVNEEKYPVKLVWFSQNIDYGRGLELILPVLKDLKSKVELTLIGDIRGRFREELLNCCKDFIKIIPPMAQVELHKSLKYFDIGLTLDMDYADLNRQLSVTNKLIAYFQSGLYILATDTPAQKQFLQAYARHGVICGQDASSLINALVDILGRIDIIRRDRLKRCEEAKLLSWEHEGEKILQIWREVI